MRNQTLSLVILLFCSIFVACNNSKSQKSNDNDIPHGQATDSLVSDRGYIVNVGDTAPDFEMQLPDGKKIILSSLRGKIVMLQFTASWCGVCRKEMPHIENEIWQPHRNNPNFAVFGIDREEPIEKIDALKKATGVTYPIVLDSDASIFQLYAQKEAGITRNVIIDKEGKIVMLTRLYDEKEFARMVQLINTLLTR